VTERDGEKQPARPDYFEDFPEEFEQRPDGPPRDLARRARKEETAPPGSALARVEEMRRRVEEMAREEAERAQTRTEEGS
jgi:hypothetical protein